LKRFKREKVEEKTSSVEPIKYNLWPHQQTFFQSNSPYIAFYGGVDNGKTVGLCLKGLAQALKYKCSGSLCRATYPELRDTTRKIFFRLFGCDEVTIRDHPYVRKWDAESNFMRLINGSEIRFRHLGDENAIKAFLSSEYDWVGIDQAEEVAESAFTHLSHRIGRVKTDIPQWIGLVGNPAGHDWIWERFKRDADINGFSEGGLYHLIEAETGTNPLLGDGYIERERATLSKNEFQRFILGSWDTFYGRVYDNFTAATHVIEPFPIPDEWKAGAGIDFGWNNPTAVNWVAVDYYGLFHIYQEHVASEKPPLWHSERIKAYGIEVDGAQLPIYGDPSGGSRTLHRDDDSAQTLMGLYSECGITIQPGSHRDKLFGINLIHQLLDVDELRTNPYTKRRGCPGVLVHRSCENTIKELGLYRWEVLRPGQEISKPHPERVVKVNDHNMDALNYFFMSYLRDHKPEEKKDMPPDIEDLFKAFDIKRLKGKKDWRFA